MTSQHLALDVCLFDAFA
ncbi:DUF645 family protein [Vibrio mimicus]